MNSPSDPNSYPASMARRALVSGFVAFDLALLGMLPGWLSSLRWLAPLPALAAIFYTIRAQSLTGEAPTASLRGQTLIGQTFAVLALIIFAFFALAGLAN